MVKKMPSARVATIPPHVATLLVSSNLADCNLFFSNVSLAQQHGHCDCMYGSG